MLQFQMFNSTVEHNMARYSGMIYFERNKELIVQNSTFSSNFSIPHIDLGNTKGFRVTGTSFSSPAGYHDLIHYYNQTSVRFWNVTCTAGNTKQKFDAQCFLDTKTKSSLDVRKSFYGSGRRFSLCLTR